MARCKRRRPLLSDTTDNDTQRPAPIYSPCASTLAPDGALDGTTVPMRDPFPVSNTLDRDRIVVPAGGTFGVTPRCHATALTRKSGVSHGSVICRPTSESTWTMGAVRGSCTRPPCRVWGPKYARTPSRPFPSSFQNTQPTPLFSRSATTRLSPAWNLPLSHRHVRPAGRRSRRALGLVILLAAYGRPYASGEGGRHAGNPGLGLGWRVFVSREVSAVG